MDILLVVVIVIHHITQMDDTGHIQCVGTVDETVNGSIHHIRPEFHRILSVR